MSYLMEGAAPGDSATLREWAGEFSWWRRFRPRLVWEVYALSMNVVDWSFGSVASPVDAPGRDEAAPPPGTVNGRVRLVDLPLDTLGALSRIVRRAAGSGLTVDGTFYATASDVRFIPSASWTAWGVRDFYAERSEDPEMYGTIGRRTIVRYRVRTGHTLDCVLDR